MATSATRTALSTRRSCPSKAPKPPWPLRAQADFTINPRSTRPVFRQERSIPLPASTSRCRTTTCPPNSPRIPILAKYLLAAFPTPQNPGPYFGFYRSDGLWLNNGNNVYYLRGVKNTDNRWAVRVDHNLSDRDRLFVRFTDIPLTSGRFFGFPASFPGNLSPSDQSWANDTAINEAHVISPSMVNEVRLMYMRNHQLRGESPAALSKDWGASFGLTPATAGVGFPQFALSDSIGNIFNGPTFGNASGLQQIDENYQFSDDVTWTRGRHTMKFGVDIRRLQSNQINLGGIWGGSYGFGAAQTNNGTTGGNGLASLILGLIGSYSNTPVEVPNYYRWHYYGGFFQDDFKLRPNLTLNLGVRYEVETPRIDKYNSQGTFIPGMTGTLNGQAATGAFCFSGSCGLSTSLWPTNYMGFEPRVGISWAPTGRLTLRSSFDLLRIPLTGYSNTPNPNLNVSSFSVGGLSGGTAANQPVDYITNPVGHLTSALAAYQGGGPFFSVLGVTIPYVDQTNVTPYAMQWGMTLQYQVDRNTMVQASYNGLRGVHLITNLSRALNFPDLTALKTKIASGYNFTTQIPNPYGITNYNSSVVNNESTYQAMLPYQNFYNQTMQELNNRAGSSIYNALYLNVNRRLGHGLSIQGSFSWSKSIDTTGNDGNTQNAGAFATAAIQNPYDLKQERAVSSFDIPTKLTSGYSWELPLGRGKLLSTHVRVLDAIIGNWTTSGHLQHRIGAALCPGIGKRRLLGVVRRRHGPPHGDYLEAEHRVRAVLHQSGLEVQSVWGALYQYPDVLHAWLSGRSGIRQFTAHIAELPVAAHRHLERQPAPQIPVGKQRATLLERWTGSAECSQPPGLLPSRQQQFQRLQFVQHGIVDQPFGPGVHAAIELRIPEPSEHAGHVPRGSTVLEALLLTCSIPRRALAGVRSMHPRKRRVAMLCRGYFVRNFLILLLLGAQAWAGAPRVFGPSGELTFRLADRLDHPFVWWPRTLLEYPVRFDARSTPGSLTLVDGAGAPVPFQ